MNVWPPAPRKPWGPILISGIPLSSEDTMRCEDNMCLDNFVEAEWELQKALKLLAEAKKLAQAGELQQAQEALFGVERHASEAKEYAQGCRGWAESVPLGTALPEEIVDYEDA